jgi:hypothetical protein
MVSAGTQYGSQERAWTLHSHATPGFSAVAERTPAGPSRANVYLHESGQGKRVLEYVSKGVQVRGIQVTLRQEQIPSYQDVMALCMSEIIEKAKGLIHLLGLVPEGWLASPDKRA